MNKRRFIIACGAIMAVLFIALVAASSYFYHVSVNRGGQVKLYSGEQEASATPIDAAVEQDKINVREWYKSQEKGSLEQISFDGLKLKATYIPSKQPSDKAVILAHGYRGKGEDMKSYAKFYHDLGFQVLMPDARGHGQSEGDYVGYGWHDRKDYVGWITMLTKQANAKQIFLHGISMGGATVLMTSGEDLPSEVKGIIEDSGFTSVTEELSYQLKNLYHLPTFPLMQTTGWTTKLRAGYSFEEASAIEQVKKNTRPLFIIHGDQDKLVPTEMAYRIFDAAQGEKQLWIVPGAGHTKSFTIAKVEYQDRVKNFIEKALH
ncbi:alpha/beta hydrolase [Brevibacillus laterosporus]|uniref:Alpha/beta hydrolase n=1 Tax=Brevibacillus laterosporus TaxID=1465 RepID=A0A518V3C0_BRELA|nr:alpha/beta hydrolase [Brevibacillus laterosporus]QDX91479.1 alpha/beta hydrolase [Brevibacillus laterosporus]TPG69849.1 alpha/beta hydrolase [Brevibacillus laterosporus]